MENSKMSRGAGSRFAGKNPIIVAVIAAIIFGAAGFFGGMKYQENKIRANFGDNQRGQFNQRRAGNGGAGFNAVRGSIISFENNNLTVKMPDNSSKIVLLTDSTVINKSNQAVKDDLKPGENVMVFGQTNSDGSVTAQNIQLGSEIFQRPQQ